MKIRGVDAWGDGSFGSSRDGGKRRHDGVDLVLSEGESPVCLNQGEVTKIGYAYGDDLSFRYIEITDPAAAKWRYFYVSPSVEVGDIVQAYTKIGDIQSLQGRYPGITDHVHLGIKTQTGIVIDPTGFVVDV